MSKVNDLLNLRNSTQNFELNQNNLDKSDDSKLQSKTNLMNESSNSINNHKKDHNSRIEIDANIINNDNHEDINNTENLQTKVENVENKQKLEEDKEEAKNKIFMTDYKLINFDNKEIFTFHDMIIPGGKNAKLCLINEPGNKNLRITEIADHYKFYEPTPTIVLIGANTKTKYILYNYRGKLLAGLTRAACNTKAIIIDSGLQTGSESFCIRKKINLIGVAPESMVEYPKPNPDKFSNKILTSGHSHFILIGNESNRINWGEEYKIKLSLAERFAMGRKGFPYKTKVVGVIFGNIPNCEDEIVQFIEKGWPLILIEDSDLSQLIKSVRNGEELNPEMERNLHPKRKHLIEKICTYPKVIEIDDDSEVLASAIHLSLTISF